MNVTTSKEEHKCVCGGGGSFSFVATLAVMIKQANMLYCTNIGAGHIYFQKSTFHQHCLICYDFILTQHINQSLSLTELIPLKGKLVLAAC